MKNKATQLAYENQGLSVFVFPKWVKSVPPRCMPGWDVSIKLFPQLGNYPPVRESS
jgi:hypothetical protein